MKKQYAMALALSALLILPAAAQPTRTSQGREAGITIEVLRPSFDTFGSTDVSLTSVAVFFSGRYPLSDQVDLVAELPVSRLDVDFEGEGNSGTGLGNPYAGLEAGSREGTTYAEVGVRLPLASQENVGLITGLLSDIDRLEAFLADVLTISGAVNYVYRQDRPGLGIRFRAGPDVWVFTKDDFDDDLELFVRYGAQAWYDAGQVRLGGGLSGRLIATEDNISFNNRTAHQAILSVTGDVGGVRPGFHLRLPFDYGEDEGPDYVLGLSLTLPL